MRGGRQSLVLGVVAFGVTLGVVRASRAAAEADADVDDPKMSRVYQAPPRPAPAPVAKPTNVQPAKATPPKVEPPKVAQPKAEPPKVAPPKTEPPKVAPPKVEVAKVEPKPSKPEMKPEPKVEPPKKSEPSKTEPPKAQPPQMAEKATEKAAEKTAAPPPAPAPVAAAPVGPPPPAPSPSPAPAPASDENAKPKAPSVDVAARPNSAREDEHPPQDRAWPYAPRLKLAYRRFPFARVGAAGSATAGASTSESFESVSIDLYPMSWFLRVGLSTQFGWESEKFDRSGDYFIAESASVGFQWPGRFTPFIEGLAGAGYMRRVMADWNLPTAYWQVGIDAGVEIYLANRAYVSVAVGYLHPGNLFVMEQSLMSVKTDSWSLKFGVGI